MPKPIVVIVEVPEIEGVFHPSRPQELIGYQATAYLCGVPHRGQPAESIDHARANSLRAIEYELGREYRAVHSLFAE